MNFPLEIYHIESLREYGICVCLIPPEATMPGFHQNVTGTHDGARFSLRVIGTQKMPTGPAVYLVPNLDPIGE